MRYCLLAYFILFSFAGLCSQDPVHWTISATQGKNQQYTLSVSGIIEPGWHVYAETNEELGLEGITITPDLETAYLLEQRILTGASVNQLDVIFDMHLYVFQHKLEIEQDIRLDGHVPEKLWVTISGFAANDSSFIPFTQSIEVMLEGGAAVYHTIKLNSVDLASPAMACGEAQSDQGLGFWSIFLKGFAGGLLALLMPCIFPMLPVTVSFFMNRAKTKQQGIRNGFLYGIFIFGIYVLASIPFHIAGNVNPQIFNIIATNTWVNLAFFAVFMVFAFSLFGFFELRLPGAFANSVGKKGDTGSIGGIFFMALTLAIVSFSCTGPILGFLLVNAISASNGAWALTAGMSGFGVALALPFGLFAMFPQWMKKLPRSGGWMDTLKKSLAFVELALAFKFLSNADLVAHWGLLKREVFIAIWILITLGLGLYLLGVFNKKVLLAQGLQNADKLSLSRPRRSVTRMSFGIGSLLFVIYLAPGLTDTRFANLQWVSGFPPPLSYSIYKKKAGKQHHVEPQVVNDYYKALALSKQTNKPLLVDFTGWACVNCRKMEENVWTTPEIARLIKENFILVSLYVDDRQKLPAENQFSYTSKDGTEKYIKTVGDQWASFQAENFGAASQPQYVILSPDEKLMNHPVGYTGKEQYQSWLECGIKAFQNNTTNDALSIH